LVRVGPIVRPTRLPRMGDHVQVSTAAPTRDAAVELLNSAVKARLAAGGQVTGPAVTAFWHLGELGNGEEWAVILKTTVERYPALEAHLIEAHPWNNPEVSFTSLGGSAAYLDWVTRATS
jgi:periplasmic divalent cation tolerance protein